MVEKNGKLASHKPNRINALEWALLLMLVVVGLAGCANQNPPIALEATPTASETVRATATLAPTQTVPPATSTITLTPSPTFTPSPTVTPSPTPWPEATPVPDVYTVDWGDTLQDIAARHGITLEQLLEMNNIGGARALQVGEVLQVPASISVNLPQSYLIHNSEVVFSPSYLGWDTQAYIQQQGGYLAQVTERGSTAAQIIDRVANKYHVGPRVLLALIEMGSGWVTNPTPQSLYPFGLKDPGRPTLELQATWAAVRLMEGYYGLMEGRRDWVFLSNSVPARLYPGTNPGSAAVINVLALVNDPATFADLLLSNNFQSTYVRLFGRIEGGPVMPPDGEQPYFELPFSTEDMWYFSGGPHGGWGDRESGWAALDFAPPIARGCALSLWPTLAIAPGYIVSSANGETWVDMDGDGNIHTGWAIFYMHLGTAGLTPAGTWVEAGDILGYQSCEGGHSTGTHLHIARMYNGQWMPANGPVPFQMGEWTSTGYTNESYSNGILVSEDGKRMDSCNCRSARRNRFPEVWHPGMP